MNIIRHHIVLILCLLAITVYAVPTADFTYVGECQGQDIQFTSNSTPLSGQIILHVWDFGDGNTSNAVNPTHQFEFAGFYTVTLTVFDSNGDFDISTEVVQVHSTPIASFSLNDQRTCQEDVIHFTNNSTDFTSTTWDFGDGNFSNNSDGLHSYTTASRYTVQLRVSNENCTSSMVKEITVFSVPDPVFEVANSCANENLQIDNQTLISNDPYQYEWFLNDELKSSEKDPRLLAQVGKNDLRLEVTNSHGCKSSFSRSLDVFPVESADFDVDDVCLGEQVRLQTDNSALVTNEWTLNGQNSVVGEEFAFSALTPGSNIISRKVLDSNGCRDSVSKFFTVFPVPEASFSLEDHCFETIVAPVNTSSIMVGSLSYSWTIEGQSISEEEPQVQFSQPGTFTVQLDAESDQGCRSSQAEEVVVYAKPEAGTISGKPFFCEGQGDFVVLTASNFTGVVSRWEKRESGSTYWQPISHTGADLEITELRLTTEYRVVIGNSNCEEVTSEPFNVAFMPELSVGEISGLTTVCETEELVQLSYDGLSTGRIFWEVLEGNDWVRVGSDIEVYQLNLSSPWRHIRVIISDGICQSDTSEVFIVNVVEEPLKPLISGESRYCADQEKILTAENIESTNYAWQKSQDGVDNWMTLSSNERELTLSDRPETNVYRIEIEDSICGNVYSDPVQIEILPKSIAGRIEGPGAVCDGDSLTLELKNLVGDRIDWFRVEDDQRIQSNTEVLSTIASRTVSYQAVVANAFCDPDTTQQFTVVVNQLPKPHIEIDGFCSAESISFRNPGQVGNELTTWSILNETIERDSITITLSAGQYEVSLAVENEYGCRSVDRRQFSVFGSPLAAFEVESVCSNVPVSISDLSARDLDKSWKLNDRPFLPDTLSFLDPGDYEVALTVRSEDGCTDSLTRAWNVHSVPDISVEVRDVCFGDSVFASVNSNIELQTISWMVDGEQSGSRQNFSFLPDRAETYNLEARAVSKEGCGSTAAAELQIYDQPVANFNVSNQCAGDTLLLVNTIEGANLPSIVWYESDVELGTGHELRLMRTPGRYKLSMEVISSDGCLDRKDSLIEVFERPLLSLQHEGVCEDDLFAFRVPNARPGVEYSWQANGRVVATGPEITYTPEAADNLVIAVSAMSSEGCESSLSQIVEVHPVPVFSVSGENHCYGAESTFTILEESDVIAAYTWQLDDGRSFSGTNLTTTFVNPGPQYLQVNAITSAGCDYHILDTIMVYDSPIASFFVEDVCLGKSLTTDNASFFETETAIFQWSIDGHVVSTGFNLDTLVSAVGERNVDLKLTDSNGCTDSLSRSAHVYPLPELQVVDSVLSVSKGYAVQLAAAGADSYLWQPISGLDHPFSATTMAMPLETTTYEVIGTNEYGCEDRAFVRVEVTEDFRLVPSNVLTPDGNGQNDHWVIQNAEVYENVSVRVYDRQGRLVYHNPAYRNDWEGTFGNDLLPEGTYYYEVSQAGQPQTYQGALTILRSR